jgi:hypothetical protein
MLFFSGCATHNHNVTMADKYKSCDAMAYEYQQLQERKVMSEDMNTSEGQIFHKGVVGAGIIASLNPNMLLGNYFYLYPAITIWYYNTFVESSQLETHEKRVRERIETLEYLMEQKRCNEGNH